MLTSYIEAAMERAAVERVEDGTFYGMIPGFQGVWSNAATSGDCLRELREVLEDWLVLGLRLNAPLPEIEGINLPELPAAEAVRP